MRYIIATVLLIVCVFQTSCASRKWAFGTTDLSKKNSDRLITSLEKRLPSTREDLICRVGKEPISTVNKSGETYDVWHYCYYGMVPAGDEQTTLVSRSKNNRILSITWFSSPYPFFQFDGELYEAVKAPIEVSDYPGASEAYRNTLIKRETAFAEHKGTNVFFSPNKEYWAHLNKNQHLTAWNTDGTYKYITTPTQSSRTELANQDNESDQSDDMWSNIAGAFAGAVATAVVNTYLNPGGTGAGGYTPDTSSNSSSGRKARVHVPKKTCSYCGGTGRVSERGTDYGYGASYYKKSCPSCGGKGYQKGIAELY